MGITVNEKELREILELTPSTQNIMIAGKHGIGKSMAVACMRALQKEHINKVNIIAFKTNQIGNHFWKEEGWTFRDDLNYYDFTLNEDNITKFNQ